MKILGLKKRYWVFLGAFAVFESPLSYSLHQIPLEIRPFKDFLFSEVFARIRPWVLVLKFKAKNKGFFQKIFKKTLTDYA